MPMHDWTGVDIGIFHSFRLSWVCDLARVLNGGRLPDHYYAMQERPARLLQFESEEFEDESDWYAARSDPIAIRRTRDDKLTATIQIVSPGNKNSAHAVRSFVDKACELLEQKIHLLIIDPFPPGKRDPNGLHAAIWERANDDVVQLPPEQPLILVAYEAGPTTRGYIERVAVGDELPDMPLFLESEVYVDVPLEATYSAAWQAVPVRWRRVIDPEDRP